MRKRLNTHPPVLRHSPPAKVTLAAFCAAVMLMLSGCSEQIEDQAMKRSGILTYEDYIQYTELRETGQLSEDGTFLTADQPDAEPAPAIPEGSIHVTFADNSHLNIQYYYDAELTKPVDTAFCYVEPGDRIYAGEPEYISPIGSLYQFDGFRLYEYDSTGNRGKELAWANAGSKLVLEVPADYSGSEIAVEPRGKYSKCSITLQDYYIDNSGQTQEANGSWFVNGEETAGDQAELNPAAVYSVDYAYDTSKYEFVASEPRAFSHDNGLVQFETVQADSKVETYSVRLQPLGREASLKIAMTDSAKDVYLRLSASTVQEDLRYDSGAKTGIRPDWLGGTDRLVFDQTVRMGSEITLTAESGTLLEDHALRLDVVRKDTDGREDAEVLYITSLPGERNISVYEEASGNGSSVVYQEVRITVSKVEASSYSPVSIPGAAVELRFTDTANGAVLQANDTVEDGRTVEVSIIPEAGHYVTGSDVNNDVYRKTMKYSKWVSDAEKIIEKHPIKKIRRVTLDAADDYGTCVYKLDGSEVSGTVDLREEQKLILEYTVTDGDYQIASGGGFFSWFQSKTEQKQEIAISELTDGGTVHRSDYIEIEKKGS